MDDVARPNSLEAFWMPFTPNRAFKADPRMLARAEGMYYYTPGRPAGAGRHGGAVVRRLPATPAPRIVEVIAAQGFGATGFRARLQRWPSPRSSEFSPRA